MGMERAVTFRTGTPDWAAVRDLLGTRGLAFQIGMIDGELAFPDEQPPDTWSELRLRSQHGMITVRREANRLAFVTWGNADARLLEQRDALVQAFADAGDGTVETA